MGVEQIVTVSLQVVMGFHGCGGEEGPLKLAKERVRNLKKIGEASASPEKGAI